MESLENCVFIVFVGLEVTLIWGHITWSHFIWSHFIWDTNKSWNKQLCANNRVFQVPARPGDARPEQRGPFCWQHYNSNLSKLSTLVSLSILFTPQALDFQNPGQYPQMGQSHSTHYPVHRTTSSNQSISNPRHCGCWHDVQFIFLFWIISDFTLWDYGCLTAKSMKIFSNFKN